MRWKNLSKTKPVLTRGMGYLVWVMSRLEPLMVSLLRSTPVFSLDEKRKLIEDYREIRERWVDGLSRSNSSKRLSEVQVRFPTSELFNLDDISLSVKLQSIEDDLLFFVSLSLTSLERLYLTNHIGEEEYKKYKTLVRYLPNFHDDLVSRLDDSRRSG
jgi:hypothetical protein